MENHFSGYCPLTTEWNGATLLVSGTGKAFWNEIRKPSFPAIMYGGQPMLTEYHRRDEEVKLGWQNMKRGVTLLSQSPITFIALVALGFVVGVRPGPAL